MGRKQPAEAKPAEAKPEESKEEEEDTPIVKELKVLDDKYLELERAADKECQEVRRRFAEKQKPLLEQRLSVLSKSDGGDASGTPAIPGFWLQAMKNMPQFEDLVQKHDEPILKYLYNITTENVDPMDYNKGFKLHFHFSKNPYFTNTVLSKTYEIEESSPYTQELSVKKITASEIEWNDGKDVTVVKVAKKVKGGGAKKAKQKAKETTEPQESFFREFFKSLEAGMEDVPDDLILDQDMIDDDDDDDDLLEMFMDRDHEIGSGVREQLIPFAVRWYTGEAAPDQDDDDEDGEEEDDDDDDDEDDDDDDDEDEPPKKGKAGKAKAKPKAKQEECKQQ